MQTDIAIIGAGFAGLSLAHAISRLNIDICITMIEKTPVYPDNFRADKLEPDQVKIMKDLGLFDLRRPLSETIGSILIQDTIDKTIVDTEEQYGLDYSSTIKNLRDKLPKDINLVESTVEEVGKIQKDTSRVIHLSNGEKIRARLTVICTGGGNTKLIDKLGINKYSSKNFRSLSFGFDIKRKDGHDFDFAGLKGINFTNSNYPDSIYYLTIFPLDGRTRCNMFSRLEAKDPIAKNLRKNLIITLPNYFPRIYDITGEIELTSKVQLMPTRLYRLRNYLQDSLLIIGDDFQGVDPGTGTGLSKILCDVQLLTRKYIPLWSKTNNFRKNNIKSFYSDKRKIASDINSIQKWVYYYKKTTRQNGLALKIKNIILSKGYFFILKYF